MVHCHAKNCPNKGKNKFRMFRFPSDKVRRAVWIDRCGKYYAKESSKLCELHFNETQYEQRRLDGRRKLKPNAVPRIFQKDTVHVTSTNNQSQQKSDALYDKNIQETEQHHPDELSIENGVDEHVINVNAQGSDVQSTIIDDSWITVYNNNIRPIEQKNQSNEEGPITLVDEIKRLKRELVYEKGKNQLLKANHELLRTKNENLRTKLAEASRLGVKKTKLMKRYKQKYISFLKKLEKSPIFKHFSLGLTHQKPKWSKESLKFATRIRLTVGLKTYLYLKKNLGLPLPSYSTICRNRSKFKSSSCLLRDKVSLMELKVKTDTSLHEPVFVVLMDEAETQTSLVYDNSTEWFNQSAPSL